MAGLQGNVFEGRFSVIVTGEKLDMDRIGAQLALKPTRVLHKGDRISARVNVLSGHDEWIYTVDAHESVGPDSELCGVLAHLAEHREGMTRIMQEANLKVVLHVQSDYAQMNFFIAPETMTRLLDLGLPLEISALSWGEVF